MADNFISDYAIAICILWSIATYSVAADDPNLDSFRASVVTVVASGVNPILGNTKVSSQGTGFFTSKDGFLVTARHLVTKLGKIAEDSLQFEVYFGPGSGDKVLAKSMYQNPDADIMVLFANFDGRDVKALTPAGRDGLVIASTPVYTVGFPAGLLYAGDKGHIKSFGVIDPIPVWATSLTFKSGQSGSPILRGDGRVIAMAKGDDEDASSIGYVVPVIRTVPTEYWDNSAQRPVAYARQALQDAPLPSAETRIVIEAPQKSPIPKLVPRQEPFSDFNQSCSSNRVITHKITASPGSIIDPSSVSIVPNHVIGAGGAPRVELISENEIVLRITLINFGNCTKVFGVNVGLDVPAAVSGIVKFLEIPKSESVRFVTVADSPINSRIKIPLPDLPTDKLRFSIRDANGLKPFQPKLGEIIPLDSRGGPAVLETEAVAKRLAINPRALGDF